MSVLSVARESDGVRLNLGAAQAGSVSELQRGGGAWCGAGGLVTGVINRIGRLLQDGLLRIAVFSRNVTVVYRFTPTPYRFCGRPGASRGSHGPQRPLVLMPLQQALGSRLLG